MGAYKMAKTLPVGKGRSRESDYSEETHRNLKVQDRFREQLSIYLVRPNMVYPGGMLGNQTGKVVLG